MGLTPTTACFDAGPPRLYAMYHMHSLAPLPSLRLTKKNLAVAGSVVALLAGVCVLAVNSGVIGASDTILLALRDAGPFVFFAAMALLPTIGFPMMAFTLTAGPVFGPILGAGWVIAWSMLAVTINLLLSYWLANRALRPFVGRLLTRFDYRLPESAGGDGWQVTLIVRLVPGPPYWVQSYLLGLIRVPLIPYLAVSLFMMVGYLAALVYGGEALSEGNGRMALAAGGLLVIFVLALQLLRKRVVRRPSTPFTAGAAK
jgi:uncharacterized membrane protein YdjX (TVP38/TMEM64 family)